MTRLIIAGGAAALISGLCAPALAVTSAADCQAQFEKADVTKDGTLQRDEARPFLNALQQGQVTLRDATAISKDEFLAACQKDVFANIDPAIGAGPAGTMGAGQQPAAGETAATVTEQPSTGTAVTGETVVQPTPTDQATAEPTVPESSAAATAEQPSAGTTAEQPAAGTATSETTAATATEQPSTGTATTEPAATDTTAAEPAAPETTAETTTETAAVEPEAAEAVEDEPAEQALAIPEGLMVSDLIGSTIYSRDDEALGEVKDMMLGSGSAQTPQVIVGVGGFLGIGQKRVAVDLSRLQIATTEDGVKIVMDGTRADLESLAAIDEQ